MQVFFQNNIAVQRKIRFPLQKPPGIQYDVNRRWAGKKRQPLIDRRCHEMRALPIQDTVAATGHG